MFNKAGFNLSQSQPGDFLDLKRKKNDIFKCSPDFDFNILILLVILASFVSLRFALVVGMLKSLHQLQEENRRLEEQIKTLTMKKERLQLLSAQLSVPFTPSTASSGKSTSPSGAQQAVV